MNAESASIPSLTTLFDLSGHVAIVTGCGGGIGLGIAEGLACAHADVVIVERGETLHAIERLNAIGARTLAVNADISRESDWTRIVETTLARFGRIDILVNNAGISLAKAPELVTLSEWQTIIDTNLTGAFLGARAIYPQFKQRGAGKIINIGSMTSWFGGSFNVPYTASKGGILQLTRGLAAAWGKDNIQVNAILPGFIDTAFARRAKAAVPDLEAKVLVRTPAGRWGDPSDFAGIAVFLASAASDFISRRRLCHPALRHASIRVGRCPTVAPGVIERRCPMAGIHRAASKREMEDQDSDDSCLTYRPVINQSYRNKPKKESRA
jgi:2-deoxy-D-gluconate 3-dehydrogenase